MLRYYWEWFGNLYQTAYVYDRQRVGHIASTKTADDAQRIVDALNKG
jgi:hypothetical protein